LSPVSIGHGPQGKDADHATCSSCSRLLDRCRSRRRRRGDHRPHGGRWGWGWGRSRLLTGRRHVERPSSIAQICRSAPSCKHNETVPPSQSYCDWCYGPLRPSDLTTPLGVALGCVEAAACSNCVRAGHVLAPPESLNPADVSLDGATAWQLAVAALSTGRDGHEAAARLLRRVAGYEPDTSA
jgi:hypothetical protein